MSSRRKGFEYGQGKYYITIKSIPNNITLFRETKEDAVRTFNRYLSVGKEVEWKGKWEGKSFTDVKQPEMTAS